MLKLCTWYPMNVSSWLMLSVFLCVVAEQ